MDNNRKVIIYTDGASSGNPGKGGWGAVLKYGEITKQISGYSDLTTNNKMELQAVIEALKLLKKRCDVEIFTDSVYVKDGITKWINSWKMNNWKTSKKEPVKNKELWIELDNLRNQHNINWNWVKGHADDEINNIVDKVARSEILKNTNN